MADAVTIRKTGKAEMAYVGEKPWHGLGQQLTADADLNTWTREAGMDWKISRSRVRYGEGDNQRVIEDQHVLFRSDTKDHLGIVSDTYKLVQPKEVMEFFRDLLPEGYSMNTAGTLFGGRKFWALASIGEEAVVVGQDRLRGYLLLASSADGSTKTTARPTTVRVVCNNTLQMSLSERSDLTVNVSHRSHFNANDVKKRLGLARGQFAEFMRATRQLAATPVRGADAAKDFIGSLLADTKMVTKADVTQSKPFLEISRLFNGEGLGATMDGVDGTYWGMVNAVTEYVDHRARATTDANRLDSAWFGRGDDLKSQALYKALALV